MAIGQSRNHLTHGGNRPPANAWLAMVKQAKQRVDNLLWGKLAQGMECCLIILGLQQPQGLFLEFTIIHATINIIPADRLASMDGQNKEKVNV
jgi:hypothetical protein